MKDKVKKRLRRARGEAQHDAGQSSILAPGEVAPDFSLPDASGQEISLGDLRGRPVILAFYPADGTPVCSSQLALYNEALPLFEEHGAKLLAISVDDVESHRQFAAELQLRFPLLADHDPAGQVTRAYRAFDSDAGFSKRALFVLAPDGTVHWSHVSPIGVNPGANGILAALESLDA